MRMKALREYDIAFVGLKEGQHTFDYKIENSFFELFEFNEFNSSLVEVLVTLNKKSTLLELNYKAKGSVNVNCDLSNEPFNLPLESTLDMIVKFGEDYHDNGEDIITIPRSEHKVNIAQYIYEMLVLAVPSKRIHPGIEDGTLDSDILRKLEELQPRTDNKVQNIEETDPRWDSLKKLLTDK